MKIEESNVEFFERNKIGKILRKIEVIDLIEIEVVMSEKWDVFSIAVPGCELKKIICNKNIIIFLKQ